MSDDSVSGQTGPQSSGTSHRTGLWIAVIGLIAAVVGPLVPILVARSDDSSGPPTSSERVVVSTPTTTEPPETDTSEPPDDPTDTPDAPEPTSDVRALTDLIAGGESSLTGCEEYDSLQDLPMAVVRCDTGESGPGVVYVNSFASASDLNDWMASESELYGATGGTMCDAGGAWTGPWSHRDVMIGDLTCGWLDEAFWMTWSFTDQLIALEATSEDSDKLYAWWDAAPLTF